VAQSEPTTQIDPPAPIRELTPRGFVLGAILALVLGAANAYLGLYAGMTVSASIPAAVLSMAMLRMHGGSQRQLRDGRVIVCNRAKAISSFRELTEQVVKDLADTS